MRVWYWGVVVLTILVGAIYIMRLQPPSFSAQTDVKTKAGMETATFGAGCFWGVESEFEHLPGVVTQVGYAGGTKVSPTYAEVCSGETGHSEVVEVSFDPKQISYDELLDIFWKIHDPTMKNKTQYRSVIFYHSAAQQALAVGSMQRWEKAHKAVGKVITDIEAAPVFYPAENYHQHYNSKHGLKENSCSVNSCAVGGGSCAAPSAPVTSRGEANAEDPNKPIKIYSVDKGAYVEVMPLQITEEEWRKILSKEQYQVTRQAGTERAFANAYWDNHEKGIYRCAGCGTDLFSSEQKFDSGTGWPSFTKAVAAENISLHSDTSQGMVRTEVTCRRCGGHLGHLFEDGPAPTHQRYCMNSSALTFEARTK